MASVPELPDAAYNNTAYCDDVDTATWLLSNLKRDLRDFQTVLDRLHELESQPLPTNQGMDDLSQIRGVGPKLVAQLAELGITRFDQIAMLSEADLDDEAHVLHTLKGRILKDGWIEQAARLAG